MDNYGQLAGQSAGPPPALSKLSVLQPANSGLPTDNVYPLPPVSIGSGQSTSDSPAKPDSLRPPTLAGAPGQAGQAGVFGGTANGAQAGQAGQSGASGAPITTQGAQAAAAGNATRGAIGKMAPMNPTPKMPSMLGPPVPATTRTTTTPPVPPVPGPSGGQMARTVAGTGGATSGPLPPQPIANRRIPLGFGAGMGATQANTPVAQGAYTSRPQTMYPPQGIRPLGIVR